MTLSPELLACPFCGSPAEMQPWHGGGPDKQLVDCSSTECEPRPAVTGETPAEAIAAWNARAPLSTPAIPAELLADLKAKAEAAKKRAPGLWGSDIEKSDGEYGFGDESREGFMVPYMETEHGKRLFDAHYCDVAEVQEDYDSDDDGGCSIYAWDQASKEIFDFLAAANPDTILALLAEIERRDQGGVVEALREYDKEVAKCPLRSPSTTAQRLSADKCRLCGATAKDRCGQDNPHGVVEAVRALAKVERTAK